MEDEFSISLQISEDERKYLIEAITTSNLPTKRILSRVLKRLKKC